MAAQSWRSCMHRPQRQLRRRPSSVDAGLLDVAGDRRPAAGEPGEQRQQLRVQPLGEQAGLTSTQAGDVVRAHLGQPDGQRAAHRQARRRRPGRSRPRSSSKASLDLGVPVRPVGAALQSCQRVPWPGSSGQRTVKPAAARCSPQGRMLIGVPVNPWHQQDAGARRRAARRGRRTARRRACTSAGAVGPDTGVLLGGRRRAGGRGIGEASQVERPIVIRPLGLPSLAVHEGGVLFYWFLKFVALGPVLHARLPAATSRAPSTCPTTVRRSWRATTCPPPTRSSCRCRSSGGSPSWPRPSTSPARASRAASSGRSSPAPGRCRSTGPAPRPPRPRSRPGCASCARASCSASTPRAPARPTAGSTAARPASPGWRWRPARRSSRSR